MLVLTRKVEESIMIGNDIVVSVLEIRGNQVKLGVEAPRSTAVYRSEVYKSIMEQNIRAAEVPEGLDRISGDLLPRRSQEPPSEGEV